MPPACGGHGRPKQGAIAQLGKEFQIGQCQIANDDVSKLGAVTVRLAAE